MSDAIRKHIARPSIWVHPASQHQYAINVAQLSRIVRRQNAILGRIPHMSINGENNHRYDHCQSQETKTRSFCPNRHNTFPEQLPSSLRSSIGYSEKSFCFLIKA
ncbi:hypothetical protein [uncultured Adlercreutzia sp.]|uniref:hypothetical protein n=1 Tax=uncultured Adlercreutzia sp. TaxID=875803 RepID=UPI0026F3953C|nr:hypothetical protein [uncultured Adlercreutzia sp.]